MFRSKLESTAVALRKMTVNEKYNKANTETVTFEEISHEHDSIIP